MFWPTMPPAPTANAFSTTTPASRCASALADLVERPRAEARDAERADATPSSRSSSTTSSIVPSTEPSATTTVSASSIRYGRTSPPELAAERARELGGDPRDLVERLHLLGVHEVLHLGERLGPDHRADRHRLVRVEHLPRLERRQERVDLLLRRHVDLARPRG